MNYIGIEKDAGFGIATWYKLRGDVDLQTLARALPLSVEPPKPPSAKVRLARAVKEYCAKQSITNITFLPRKVPKKHGGGYAIIKEQNCYGQFVYNEICRVTVDNVWQSPLSAIFDATKDTLTANDVSIWLSTWLDNADAIRLRPSGGIYYVPPEKCATWNAIGEALGAASGGEVYKMPVAKGDDAIAAITAAIIEDIEGRVADIRALVQDGYAHTGKPLGKRALASKDEECQALLAKVRQYETLLGTTLDKVRASVNQTRTDAVGTALAAIA